MADPDTIPGHDVDEANIARGWNWGAFWLNWVWGIAHSTWIALLMFVPGVNLVMPFVLGWKGNAWAWRNNTWRDVEHFRRTQRIWAGVGWGAAIGLPALMALLFWGITAVLTSSEPYQMALDELRNHPALAGPLGHPVVPDGWWMEGNINVEGGHGRADMAFDVKGPRGTGVAELLATKSRGVWTLEALAVNTGEDARVMLIPPPMTCAVRIKLRDNRTPSQTAAAGPEPGRGAHHSGATGRWRGCGAVRRREVVVPL